MSLNPPARRPTVPERARAEARRTFQRHAEAITLVIGIILGFVLSRL
jgi:hypothetical protein